MTRALCLAAIVVWSLTASLLAQDAPVAVPAGAAPAGAKAAPPRGPDGKPIQPGQPGQVKPGQPQPGQPADAKKEEEKPAGPAPIVRGADPKPSRPAPINIKPDAEGKVTLNFEGQKWPAVLEWYAEISGMSLDWQEMPGDYLNLHTQRSYTIDDVRDLLNRHLMDRGYTMLRHGEVIVVVNLKKLDPAMVPRVRPDDLAERQPHEFVKTSFKLDWLIAESTVEELKPMLSPHHKLWGLKATNRLEAIDAAANLLEMYSVLKDEQSNKGQDRLVREFKLDYTRAEEVYELLLGLLGQEKPKKDEGPVNPQQMMRMQQMMMQGGGQPGQPGQAQQKKEAKVHLMVNRTANSVLANGPPDLVAICEQAVRIIDVPPEGSNSLLANAGRMRVYRLTSIDPEPLVETLNQVGQLDPTTSLTVDKKNRSIIAYAPLVDHVTIKTLVDKLDGTDRRFDVIKLRRLEADYVAGTIQFMMGTPDDKQQQRRSSYYYYDPFSAMSGGSSSGEELRKFKVDADVENNRLLIWANDVELAEVEKLLVKLGEIPPEGSRAATRRTIESIPLEDAPLLLERLRKSWPAVGNNPLQLDVRPPAQPQEPADDTTRRLLDGKDTRTEVPAIHAPSPPPTFRFSKASVSRTSDKQRAVAAQEAPAASLEDPIPAAVTDDADTAVADEAAEADEPAVDAEPQPPLAARRRTPPAAPPVQIELGPDGRWTLNSDDTDALDRLEDLIAELSPPRKDYRLFKLKYSSSWAYGIALTLEDFFKDEKPKETGRSRYFYYYDPPQQDQQADSRRLSKRRELKFIADSDSNTILVVGADNNQMRTIEELIEYYDQPLSSEAKALRMTKIFQVQYSKAKVIADVIKDVYRDLLSENDKALQQPQNGQNKNEQRASERTVTYVYDNFGDSSGDKGKTAPQQPMRFKGAISLGVDELSNTITISTTEGLMENITRMVEELDLAARPTVPKLHVLRVGSHLPASDIQEKLAKVLKERKKEQPQQQQPGQQNRGQPQIQQADGNGPFGDE